MGDGPIFLCSDDNKKDTFDNGGNNGHGLKTLRVNRPLMTSYEYVLYRYEYLMQYLWVLVWLIDRWNSRISPSTPSPPHTHTRTDTHTETWLITLLCFISRWTTHTERAFTRRWNSRASPHPPHTRDSDVTWQDNITLFDWQMQTRSADRYDPSLTRLMRTAEFFIPGDVPPPPHTAHSGHDW